MRIDRCLCLIYIHLSLKGDDGDSCCLHQSFGESQGILFLLCPIVSVNNYNNKTFTEFPFNMYENRSTVFL